MPTQYEIHSAHFSELISRIHSTMIREGITRIGSSTICLSGSLIMLDSILNSNLASPYDVPFYAIPLYLGIRSVSEYFSGMREIAESL